MGGYHSCYWAASIQSLARKIVLLLFLHHFLTLKKKRKANGMVTRREEQAGLISTAISQVLFSPFKIQNQTELFLCIFNEIMSNNL